MASPAAAISTWIQEKQVVPAWKVAHSFGSSLPEAQATLEAFAGNTSAAVEVYYEVSGVDEKGNVTNVLLTESEGAEAAYLRLTADSRALRVGAVGPRLPAAGQPDTAVRRACDALAWVDGFWPATDTHPTPPALTSLPPWAEVEPWQVPLEARKVGVAAQPSTAAPAPNSAAGASGVSTAGGGLKRLGGPTSSSGAFGSSKKRGAASMAKSAPAPKRKPVFSAAAHAPKLGKLNG